MTTVEIVARAIARNINEHQLATGFAFDGDYPNGIEGDWAEYVTTAQAAIAALFAAIAEPTEGMVEAGMCKGCRENESDDFPEIYKAMIEQCRTEVLGE